MKTLILLAVLLLVGGEVESKHFRKHIPSKCLKRTVLEELQRRYCPEPDPCVGHDCYNGGVCDRGRCNCIEGFAGKYCENDINECENMNKCQGKPNSVCKNTPGSYECLCKEGFVASDSCDEECEDVDECASPNSCDEIPNSYCKNTIGSYKCECKTGFTKNGICCEDIDECVDCAHKNYCGVKPNSECKNTIGSYDCKCIEGFKETNDGNSCTDVDECDSPNSCDQIPNSYCKNTIGSYKCECKTGFTKNGICCEDINECIFPQKNYCRNIPNSECKNTFGDYYCTCIEGFVDTNNGTSCTDKDECASPNSCDQIPNSYCKNTVGSYKCECRNVLTNYEASCKIEFFAGYNVTDELLPTTNGTLGSQDCESYCVGNCTATYFDTVLNQCVYHTEPVLAVHFVNRTDCMYHCAVVPECITSVHYNTSSQCTLLSSAPQVLVLNENTTVIFNTCK